MSEFLILPKISRGVLLSPGERVERLHQAFPQILALVEGERDPVAVQASLACALWMTLPQTSWCGFYRRVEERLLAVGPYQGGLGCLRISFDRGVCGACARSAQRQLVPDVNQFPDHIACDDATRSELVLPVIDARGQVQAVLDLDSEHLDGFSSEEGSLLQELLDRVFQGAVSFPVEWNSPH